MSQPLSLTSLPLFPLGAVLFPAGTLALRVFEVRYLDMVRKCHQAGAPFGVVALTQGREVRQAGAPQEQFCDVGTLAVGDVIRLAHPAAAPLDVTVDDVVFAHATPGTHGRRLAAQIVAVPKHRAP